LTKPRQEKESAGRDHSGCSPGLYDTGHEADNHCFVAGAEARQSPSYGNGSHHPAGNNWLDLTSKNRKSKQKNCQRKISVASTSFHGQSLVTSPGKMLLEVQGQNQWHLARNLTNKNLSLVEPLASITNPNPRSIFPEKNLTYSKLLESAISTLINAQNRKKSGHKRLIIPSC
jgi:hypothetical protein